MDWQRTSIIAALAVVSYLMILQWQKDYVDTPLTEQEKNYSQSYPQEINTVDMPVSNSSDQAGAAEDIPIDLQIPESKDDRDLLTTTEHKLISVDTDVFLIKIDPVGGDVVQLALKNYPISGNNPDIPFTLLESEGPRTYIAQSGLIGSSGPDSSKDGRPHYSSEKNHYRLNDDKLQVNLLFNQDNGAKITKTFIFSKNSYVIQVETQVDNQGNSTWNGSLFGQIKRDNSPDPGLSATTGFGLPTYLGAAYWDEDKRYNKLDFEDIAETPLKKNISGGWLSMIQHYFMSAWIPNQNLTHLYNTRVHNGMNIIGFTSPKVEIGAGDSHTFAAQLYAGPKIQKDLEALLPDKGLDLAVDYGPLFFISKPLFWLLDLFHSLTGNWGFAIILLTMSIKGLFFYPSAVSYRSMAKMRKVAPEMTRLREEYADDRQKLSQEMMSLYKKEQINPLGGCLPILIQMPVFLALYWALLESVELRQAPFILWIQDLSIMDPYFVLPLLMGGSMYIQQQLNPAPPDPMQAKVMKFLPVIFTVMFLWFPAGLVLYWVTNNILSIVQQYVITKRIEAGGS